MNIEENISADERLVSPKPAGREPSGDTGLRPRSLEEYIGQETLCKSLSIFIQAARGGVSRWIMFFFMVFQALAKQPCPISSPTRWGPASR
ncbi:hypothetical protein DGMP_06920 [Desulfomarina profundi]|uniref:RuvB-like P-loop domain-containing protein n=1 Tax=Desulfomarina profundi TaxID=2772557 RepID=A0A8D5FKR2_9BACT|nr:hypothetical protein [Desulfomarina profundi]BCL59999.1 hypothetical protein DGMP_06920 [Desulfomarina profundi]